MYYACVYVLSMRAYIMRPCMHYACVYVLCMRLCIMHACVCYAPRLMGISAAGCTSFSCGCLLTQTGMRWTARRRYPYPQVDSRNVFTLLQSVVDGPPPTIPSEDYGEDFCFFVSKWCVCW